MLILFLLILILSSAFFSASEISLFSLAASKVKSFRADPDPRKRIVAALLETPRDLLVTIIMMNVIVNILIQNTASSIFGDFSSWTLTVGVPLALTLVFGEVIPKSIGLANNVNLSYRVAPSIQRFQRLFLPIRKVFIWITALIVRCLFFFLKREKEISTDELYHALHTSRTRGILNQEEEEIIGGYLRLSETQVKEIIRPRGEILYYDLGEPLSKLIHLFVEQECSRIPVCDQSLDKIVGIITGKIFFLHKHDVHSPKDLMPILKKPFFVPESMPAEALMRQMYDREESIALVVDEYGSFAGLVTLEDLVEVVIGEISDRRDEKSHFTRSGEDVLIASGKLELAEFENLFGVSLDTQNGMVTLGGWLTEQLGDIPKTGAKLMTDRFLFQVLAADPRRVRRVYIRRLKPGTNR